jgi:hypothetical protein
MERSDGPLAPDIFAVHALTGFPIRDNCVVLAGPDSADRCLVAETVPLAPGDRPIPLRLVRNVRARRYILRVAPDGAARVTIPRGGNAHDARAFALRHRTWLERQLLRREREASRPRSWPAGTLIHFRGELTPLVVTDGDGRRVATLADQVIPLPNGEADLRPPVERHLWRLAARELPPRVHELASRHGLEVRRVSIRNQRSRWGSCSRRGTISLNWRILHAPEAVLEYLILHELMHLRHMNHSTRYWQAVERACPGYRKAEDWLKRHSALLR